MTRAQRPVADAGQTAQRRLNQTGGAKDQLSEFILDNLVTAALVAVGFGYILGKIT